MINSFSKYHCMTGWRVGWAVVPPGLQPAMRALQQNLFINAPHISQIAAAAALDPECDAVLKGRVAKYARNREILMAGLPEAGFTKLSSAGGAYYIYADVSDISTDSIALCKRILDVTGVACVSGLDFDRERGHLREVLVLWQHGDVRGGGEAPSREARRVAKALKKVQNMTTNRYAIGGGSSIRTRMNEPSSPDESQT